MAAINDDSTQSQSSDKRASRPILKPVKDENGKIVITQEMRDLANAVANPKGDPYLNGRDLGFYCEQCG